MSFETYLNDREKWSIETFGPVDYQRDTRAESIAGHIRKELLEIRCSPNDLEEWIDVISLALDGAFRCAGAASDQILPALVAKLEKCKLRTWPGWRTQTPGQPIEHVRTPHRAQRVTTGDLAAVRAQELADFAPRGVAVSEPVSIREMPSLVAPQPAPTASRGREIWPLVIADMAARDAMGREKYGHPLRANNGRRPLVDAYQEVLDLAVYLRQEIEEREEPPTWQQTAENLRDALATVTKERDEALARTRVLAAETTRLMRCVQLADTDLDTARASLQQIRDLLTIENDGPEEQTSWILGQVRRVLGLCEESDAETLDLSVPGVEETGGES